ncbi:hypothetical protein [Candidatus Nitrospira bockiana]
MPSKDEMMQALPEEPRETLKRFVRDTTKLFGGQLAGLLVYGSAARLEYLPGRSNLNFLILLDRYDRDLLTKYAGVQPRWSREQVVVPLFLTDADVAAVHGLFPLEYSDIKEHHVLLAGRDPFLGIEIDSRCLGFEAEQEVRGNLVRVRQRLVEGGGTTEAMAILLPLSLTSMLAALRGVFRLFGCPTASTETILTDAQVRLGIDPGVFRDVWNLKRGLITPGPVELPRLFDRYVSALQALADRLGEMRQEGRL